MMTRKDYIDVAKLINDHGLAALHGAFITDMAAIMAADNPKFDEAVFRVACGQAKKIGGIWV